MGFQETIVNEVMKRVYDVALPLFSALETEGLIVGRAPHLARRLALQAGGEIKRRWIYETKEGQHLPIPCDDT